MNIRFTSTLTPDDENRLAPAVLHALSAILDLLPIAYVLEIETADLQTYHQGGQDLPHLFEHSRLDARPADAITMES